MMEADRNARLTEAGFVILDLLGPDAVRHLYQLCDRFLGGSDTDFVSSSHVLSDEDSAFINAELHRLLAESMRALFPQLQLLGGTLATKVKGNSVLVAHQDWAIVDESQYRSFNLWIPLVDTDSRNGTLGLVPGSHRWYTFPRGLGISNPFDQHTAYLMRLGYEPSLRAGQAILYDHRLIHYSRPNQTAQRRHVAIIGMKETAADMRVSFSTDGATIDCFEAAEADFYRFDAGRVRQANRLLHSRPNAIPAPDRNAIAAAYSQWVPAEYRRPVKAPGILEKLRELFA